MSIHRTSGPSVQIPLRASETTSAHTAQNDSTSSNHSTPLTYAKPNLAEQQTTALFAQSKGLQDAPQMGVLSLQIAQQTGQIEVKPPIAQNAVQVSSPIQPQQKVKPLIEAEKKEHVIQTFYRAMEEKDLDTILSLYHPDATFSDPAFPMISGDQLRGMWKLITSNKSLKVQTRDVKMQADGRVTGHWDADYHIIKGNPILNSIDSSFKFKDGKIIEHKDSFDFSKWAKQAFPGLLGTIAGSRLGRFVLTRWVFPRRIAG